MDFANMTTSDIEQMMLGNAMKQHERLSQPDDGAKWLAMAQAMGSPTRTGSFGEGLGNVAGALGQYNTGEQGRKDSAYEAMNKALAIAYKQRMDLEEKKRTLKDKLKPKFFQTAEGTFGFANENEGTVDVRALGPSQMRILQKLQEKHTDILAKQGTYTDANELAAAAYKLAMNDYRRMMNDTNFVPAQVGVSNGEASPEQDVPDVTPQEQQFLAKAREMGLDDSKIAQLMNSSPALRVPASSQPMNKPRSVQSADRSSTQAEVVPIKTPQQIEQENALARNIAEQDTKYVQAQRDALDAYRPTVDSINRMEQLTLNGTSEGPLSDLIATTGGVVNYFDPDSKLAKIAGDDAAYFSALQNLVRDKIAALGAGTAISNLDLIVTQSSVGGLLKTKQGRLKILGALKADAETARMIQEDKIAHFEKTGGLKGYRPPTRPLVGLISKPQILPDGTKLNMYAPITSDKWMAAAKAKNPKATDAVLEREWTKFVKSFGGSK